MSYTKAYGKYFDGNTSKPYDVTLEIWHEKEISFFHNNVKKVWKFSDITFDKNNETLFISIKENHAESLRINNPYVVNLIYNSAKNSKNLSWYQNLLDLGSSFPKEKLDLLKQRISEAEKSLQLKTPFELQVSIDNLNSITHELSELLYK